MLSYFLQPSMQSKGRASISFALRLRLSASPISLAATVTISCAIEAVETRNSLVVRLVKNRLSMQGKHLNLRLSKIPRPFFPHWFQRKAGRLLWRTITWRLSKLPPLALLLCPCRSSKSPDLERLSTEQTLLIYTSPSRLAGSLSRPSSKRLALRSANASR